jgi:uncharacterized protein (DUF1800 family)
MQRATGPSEEILKSLAIWGALAGLVTLSIGASASSPVITAVTPNPLPVGTINVTITGTGFQTGALVYESYASYSMIQSAASSVTATTVTVNGLYQGPGTTATFYVRNPDGAYSAGFAVPIAGSNSTPPAGGSSAPVISAVNPNPLPVGTINVTLTGTGFQTGALVYESYGSYSMIQSPASSVTATTVTVNGLYQGPGTTATFYVRNPNGTYSAGFAVPIGGGSSGGSSGGGSSSVPAITAVNPNPLPVGTGNVTITGTGFQQGALVYQSYGSQSMIQYSSSSVTSTTVTVNGMYQGPASTAMFCVKNPGTACSNSLTVSVVNNGPPPAPTIAPAAVNVNLGGTQQFNVTNATSITATAGSITPGGLYTAPAAMPASSTVTITATGAGGAGTAKITLINPNPQLIAPTAVTLAPGGTQQFNSQGATAWSAVSGTVTQGGFYTAPAVWPATGQDIVTVTGPNGTATAVVTITPPTPVVTGVGSNNYLPLGIFSAAVQGTGFVAQSTATLGGSPVNVVYSGGGLTISGFDAQNGPANLVVTNAGVSSQPFSVQVGAANAQTTPTAARRFLQQAAFGPTPADADHVQSVGFAGWIAEQLAMPQISNYNAATGAVTMPAVFLTNAVTNADQLRQKVAFALSQIFVTSLTKVQVNSTMIPYQNMLLADAFTNFKQILTDVTLSPCMGQYLDMANNAVANPAAGTAPNENYAREVMQLMSVGTKVLNPDGTWPVDANGLPLATYQQSDVSAMARILTGWTWGPAQPGGNAGGFGGPINPNAPMAPWPPQHDAGAKTVMGYAAPAGLSPQDDLNGILGYLAKHPNTAPFISSQLIQHMVKSNPSAQYVGRVSAAFTQSNGDMPTVIKAILLDPEARANDQATNDQPADGHLQEPALFLPGLVRAFGGQMNTGNFYASTMQSLGQDIFNAPSVFNYYAPGFGVTGTGGLLGPEFQIDNPNAAILRENLVGNLFNSFSTPVLSNGPGTTIDLTPFLPLAANPATLVEAIDLTLTEGAMPAAMKNIILTAVKANAGNGALYQVETAAYLTLVSSYYNVWH